MTYPQEVFTTFAFVGFLISIIPLTWHLEAWNMGTCLYLIWTAIGCLNLFINSVVWRNSTVNSAPVWCDISSRIIVTVGIAVPAASLCINRRLYRIASLRSVIISRWEQRREIIIDLAISLGIPLVYQVFYYINQGRRYDILEDVGCWPFIYSTWVAKLLMSAPSLLVGFVTIWYAVRSIILFNASRIQFKEFISNHTNLTSSRYFRLMSAAGIDVLNTILFSIASMYFDSVNELRPWENTHIHSDRVLQFPSVLWRANRSVEFELELSRWMTVSCAFVFFGFSGFSKEARLHYRLAFNSITKTLGRCRFIFFSSTSSSGSSDAVFESETGSSIPVLIQDSMPSMDGSVKDACSVLSEKRDVEKSPSTFAPTVSNGAMILNDAGGVGTLPDYSDYPISHADSSSTSSLGTTPPLTRQNSTQEISSLRRDSIAPVLPAIPDKAHTHDVV